MSEYSIEPSINHSQNTQKLLINNKDQLSVQTMLNGRIYDLLKLIHQRLRLNNI